MGMEYRSVDMQQYLSKKAYEQLTCAASYLLFSEDRKHERAMRQMLKDCLSENRLIPDKFFIRQGVIILDCMGFAPLLQLDIWGTDNSFKFFQEQGLNLIMGPVQDKGLAQKFEGREIPFDG